jgi:hypothetical protein
LPNVGTLRMAGHVNTGLSFTGMEFGGDGMGLRDNMNCVILLPRVCVYFRDLF